MPEEPVGIQIQASVKAVAVVEVPFHDHLEAAEVVKGAFARIDQSCRHWALCFVAFFVL